MLDPAAHPELLEGVEGAAREARIELLKELTEAGVPLEELRLAVAEDRLALLPVERVLAAGVELSAREVAERCGLTVDFVLDTAQALGLVRVPADEPAFTEEDAQAYATLGGLRAAGLPDEGLLETARVLGHGLWRTAEAMTALVGNSLLQEGDTERDLSLRYAQAGKELAPLLGPLLESTLAAHLRQGMRGRAVTAAEMDSGRFDWTEDVVVGFADLVGFTGLGEVLPSDELGSVAGRLARIAGQVASPEVRLVKTIGDAAMLVAREPAVMLEAAFALLERGEAEGEGFPTLRVGVASGPAAPSGGDWYGQAVNLASRVTARARPGSVLATDKVRDALRDSYSWSRTGEHRFKGVPGTVKLYRARPVSEAG